MEEELLGRKHHGGGTPPLTRDVTPKQRGNGEEVPTPASLPCSGFQQVPPIDSNRNPGGLGTG